MALQDEIAALKTLKSTTLGESSKASSRRRSVPESSVKCSTSNDDQTELKGTMDCGNKGDSWFVYSPRALLYMYY